MNAWVVDDVSLDRVLGASLTNESLSKPFRITAGGSLNMRIEVAVSGVTVGGGITAKLQSSSSNDFSNAIDSKTVSISGNGTFHIKLLSADSSDWTYLPLLSMGRVVVTTGVGSALTIESVRITQEQ